MICYLESIELKDFYDCLLKIIKGGGGRRRDLYSYNILIILIIKVFLVRREMDRKLWI